MPRLTSGSGALDDLADGTALAASSIQVGRDGNASARRMK